MIPYSELNSLKKDAFDTKSEEEYKAWQTRFKEWLTSLTLTKEERKRIVEQITLLDGKKKAYFEKYRKPKQYPQKTSYILREDEGKALINYLNALAEYYRNLANQNIYPNTPWPQPLTYPTTYPSDPLGPVITYATTSNNNVQNPPQQ